MRITKTVIDQLIDDGTDLKALVTIVIDDALTITGILVMEYYDGQHHLVMPGWWDQNGKYSEYLHFADKEVYEYFRKIILTAYKNHKILDDIYDLPEGYKGG